MVGESLLFGMCDSGGPHRREIVLTVGLWARPAHRECAAVV